MFLKNKKILITGAAGFVGSHLARKLVSGGAEVYTLLRSSSNISRVQDIFHHLHVENADMRDREEISRIFEKVKPDGVFHLAASQHHIGKSPSVEELTMTNIVGTAHLMDEAQKSGVEFFINTGTFTEYAPKNVPVSESGLCEPREMYSITRHTAGMYGKALALTKNFPVITLRPFTPYGPGIQPKRLVRAVVESALAGKEILLGDPQTSRDFIFVEDLAELYLAAAVKAKAFAGETFNAGTGKSTTQEELIKTVLLLTKSKSVPHWNAFPKLAYDSDLWQSDTTKTFSVMEWRPKYSIEEGIKETIGWIKNLPPSEDASR